MPKKKAKKKKKELTFNEKRIESHELNVKRAQKLLKEVNAKRKDGQKGIIGTVKERKKVFDGFAKHIRAYLKRERDNIKQRKEADK